MAWRRTPHGNQKGGTESRRRPREQLEPYVRDQCSKTVATMNPPIEAPIRAQATARNIDLAVMVVFTARTSL
jgi:hypothetical protein